MKKILLVLAVAIAGLSFVKKPVKWVAIGDSITYLNDHLNETGNRVTKGYLTLVKEQVRGLEYVNKGYNGWTSGGIAEKFDQLQIPIGDVYTVFLGTNDWWQGRPIGDLQDYTNNNGNQTIFGSFKIIIDKLKKLNAKASIILITPMKRTDFVYLFNKKNNAWGSYKEKDRQTLEAVVNAIVAIAKQERFKLVDLYHDALLPESELVNFKRLKNPTTGDYENYPYPRFQNISFNPDIDEYPYPPEAINLTYDGLHPSDKGNQIIAKRIVHALKK